MIRTLISGGQTGADRAALDFALAHGLTIKGFCPRGRRADDGPLDAKYPLLETASSAYPPRTRENVLLADATVIFNGTAAISRGTHVAAQYARQHAKRYTILRGFPHGERDAASLRAWLHALRPESLNVAGNSEAHCPGMYAHVFAVLQKVLL